MNKEKENISFFNKWAHCYDWPLFGSLRILQRKVLQEIVKSEDEKKKNESIKILDIGCGTGYSLLWLSKQVKWVQLFGVDLSPEMLRIARAKLQKEKVKAPLKQASVDKLPFQSDTFDYIVCTSAFHHFPDQIKALQEMKRVLKNGGVLLLADENFFFLNKLIKLIEPGHTKMNSKEEFRALFAQAGVRLVKQKRAAVFGVLNIGRK